MEQRNDFLDALARRLRACWLWVVLGALSGCQTSLPAARGEVPDVLLNRAFMADTEAIVHGMTFGRDGAYVLRYIDSPLNPRRTRWHGSFTLDGETLVLTPNDFPERSQVFVLTNDGAGGVLLKPDTDNVVLYAPTFAWKRDPDAK